MERNGVDAGSLIVDNSSKKRGGSSIDEEVDDLINDWQPKVQAFMAEEAVRNARVLSLLENGQKECEKQTALLSDINTSLATMAYGISSLSNGINAFIQHQPQNRK